MLRQVIVCTYWLLLGIIHPQKKLPKQLILLSLSRKKKKKKSENGGRKGLLATYWFLELDQSSFPSFHPVLIFL